MRVLLPALGRPMMVTNPAGSGEVLVGHGATCQGVASRATLAKQSFMLVLLACPVAWWVWCEVGKVVENYWPPAAGRRRLQLSPQLLVCLCI